ncbi:hypothetical protein D3C74_413830 [compost metagenome]
MVEGILHNRLQNQLNRLAGQHFVLSPNLITEFIFEAEALNDQIMPDMIQLLLHSDHILPFA